MRIILTTENTFAAARLKDRILKAVKGELPQGAINTWSYIKAADNYDIIYLNQPQFTDIPEKNVVFRVELNGENIIITPAYWTHNPQPSNEIFCLHVGRLTEMILTHFQSDFSKFSILD